MADDEKRPPATYGPYKLDDSVTRTVVAAVRRGLPIMQAMALVKVSRGTYYRWMKRARDGDAEYQDFFHKVEQARAAQALQLLSIVGEAAIDGGDVKAATWLLQHLHGIGAQAGAPAVAVNVQANGVARIESEPDGLEEGTKRKIARLPTDQLDELYKRLTKTARGDVIDAEEG